MWPAAALFSTVLKITNSQLNTSNTQRSWWIQNFAELILYPVLSSRNKSISCLPASTLIVQSQKKNFMLPSDLNTPTLQSYQLLLKIRNTCWNMFVRLKYFLTTSLSCFWNPDKINHIHSERWKGNIIHHWIIFITFNSTFIANKNI